MLRLFVGLRPPPEIRAILMSVMGGVPNARWQRDDQLHLTLRFIGEVSPRTADEIALVLGGLKAGAPEVALAGIGRFDHGGRTDTIWAGVAPTGPLAALHRKVDRALVQVGMEPEGRAFVPHITIARLPRSAGRDPAIDAFVGRHAGLASPVFRLPHLTLFESQLGSDGADYLSLSRWPLD